MPPAGIRTRNTSKQAAADPRLRPHGCWDRRNPYPARYIDLTNLTTNNKQVFMTYVPPSFFDFYKVIRKVVHTEVQTTIQQIMFNICLQLNAI